MTILGKFLKISTSVLTITLFFSFAAYAGNLVKSYQITSTGIIKQRGFTTYMYGTHILVNDTGKTLYALKSAI